MRILTTIAFSLSLLSPVAGVAEDAKPQMTLYKTPQCDCCEGHAEHLRQSGFDVETIATHDLSLIKQEHDVPAELAGCHTILVDGYVVEGHVSASIIERLLAERPAIKGISLPGMPTGSPGMAGPKTEPFTIYTFGGEGDRQVYAVE
jgi:hypothetical protein